MKTKLVLRMISAIAAIITLSAITQWTTVRAQQKEPASTPSFAEVEKQITHRDAADTTPHDTLSISALGSPAGLPEPAMVLKTEPIAGSTDALNDMEHVLASPVGCGEPGIKAIDRASSERIAIITSKVTSLKTQIENYDATDKDLKSQLQDVLRLQPAAVDSGQEIDDLKHRIDLANVNGTSVDHLAELLRRATERQTANDKTRKQLSDAANDLNSAMEKNAGNAEIVRELLKLGDAESLLWQSFFMGRKARQALDCSARAPLPSYEIQMTPGMGAAATRPPK